MHTQRDTHVKRPQEGSYQQAKERGLGRNQPCRHLAPGLLSPEPWVDKLLSFKPFHLWCFCYSRPRKLFQSGIKRDLQKISNTTTLSTNFLFWRFFFQKYFSISYCKFSIFKSIKLNIFPILVSNTINIDIIYKNKKSLVSLIFKIVRLS